MSKGKPGKKKPDKSKKTDRKKYQMPVNLNKPELWKEDITKSVDQYNQWFLKFAPKTYREERKKATADVEAMLLRTDNLRRVTPAELTNHPGILFALRMSTAPPLARDRLIGLADVAKSLVGTMEKNQIVPRQMKKEKLAAQLDKITTLIMRLADVDIFPRAIAPRSRFPAIV